MPSPCRDRAAEANGDFSPGSRRTARRSGTYHRGAEPGVPLGRFARMSRRGLLVALLCGVLGIGLGMIAAYAAQPTSSTDGTANPISAVNPSVPVDEPPEPPK